jgi:signal transduction histidine kinase
VTRWWREAAVTGAAFGLCLFGGVIREDGTLGAPPLIAWVLAVVSCAVLPLRHRVPLVAVAVTTVCGALVQPFGLLPTPLTVAPAVIAAYALLAGTEQRAAAWVAVTSAGLLMASAPLSGRVSWQDMARLALVAAFPVVGAVLGRSAQNRRAYLAAVRERAERAERSREAEALRRVGEERVRIARELHDLVAHQITLANAQATVAAHLFDTRPEQSRRSLDELVATTRHALDDLRATVGLLRQSGDAESAEPAPGLGRLPELIETFWRAGLDVSVERKGTVRVLPPGLDLTAYRIVQEALTNVTKHARTKEARVCLEWGPDDVTVSVADDGNPVPGKAPGYGLIGMRERAAAVGGSLSAGPRSEGGFLVSARLPLPVSAA